MVVVALLSVVLVGFVIPVSVVLVVDCTHYTVGPVKSPNLFLVAAKSLHYEPKRPLSSQIVKLNFGNQLGLGPKGWGYNRAII